MAHGKKKFAGSRDASNKVTPLGVLFLAGAVGAVIGSAGTFYVMSSAKQSAPQSASRPAAATPQGQTTTMVPQQQFTPAPQPPGAVPPGKVWSVEHGHWHDAPAATATASAAPGTTTPASPAPATEIPFVTPAPAPGK